MNERSYASDGEISLVDVYRFIKEGWKTFALAAALGGIIGAGLSYRMPDQFSATGLIRPAQVSDVPLEDINVLVEKMRSPTFFTAKTLEACGSTDGKQLSDAINASISRQSAFISVSYRSGSSQLSRDCLQAVLSDVNKNQAELMAARSKSVEDDLKASKKLLAYTDIKQRNELELTQDGLELAEQELADAKTVLGQLEAAAARLTQDDDHSLESSMLLSVVLSKKADIRSLESSIQDLGKRLNLLQSSQEDISLDFDSEVYQSDKKGVMLKNQEKKSRTLRARISELERDLLPPATEAAKFATPIYAPEYAVGPRRMMFTVVALLFGALAGLGLLLVRHLARHAVPRLG